VAARETPSSSSAYWGIAQVSALKMQIRVPIEQQERYRASTPPRFAESLGSIKSAPGMLSQPLGCPGNLVGSSGAAHNPPVPLVPRLCGRPSSWTLWATCAPWSTIVELYCGAVVLRSEINGYSALRTRQPPNLV